MSPRMLLAIILLVASVGSLQAQTIPAKGSEATLDIATWNIEWFGAEGNGPSDDAQQLENVLAVMRSADIDLWGVQEIASPDLFDVLLDSLGGDYDGFLATQSSQQRIGFVYKPSVFTVRQARHILTSFDFATRPPLQLDATATLPDTTVEITFIVVHMKAFSDLDSYNRRVEGAGRLKNHIDFTALASEPVMILGDFNDELTRSITTGQPSPYDPFLQDIDHYFFPSLAIEQADQGTFCGSSRTCSGTSTIDHILVTDELASAYEPGSAQRYAELLGSIPDYVFSTSDHLPVIARFQFRRETALETMPGAGPHVGMPYPNPFRTSTSMRYRLDRPSTVRVTVYDALGREVATLVDAVQPAGEHRATLDAADLPAGLYVLHLIANGQAISRPLVHLR